MPPTIGLQLYTVRDDMQRDFKGTMTAVARAGYREVGYGGTGGMTVPEFKAFMDSIGLTPLCAGGGLDTYEKGIEKFLDTHTALGAKYCMLGWLPPERRRNKDDWMALAGKLNEWGKATAARGIAFQYHNHDFEFTPVDGTFGGEILAANTDPKFVKFQVDVGWVTWAGHDAVGWLKRLGAGRIPTIHLKDLVTKPANGWTEVGTGVLDVPGVLKACGELGVACAMVEQDTCSGPPPLESIKISLANARKALAAA